MVYRLHRPPDETGWFLSYGDRNGRIPPGLEEGMQFPTHGWKFLLQLVSVVTPLQLATKHSHKSNGEPNFESRNPRSMLDGLFSTLLRACDLQIIMLSTLCVDHRISSIRLDRLSTYEQQKDQLGQLISTRENVQNGRSSAEEEMPSSLGDGCGLRLLHQRVVLLYF